MDKIGVGVTGLDHSEQTYLLTKQINEYCGENKGSATTFFENQEYSGLHMNFSVMPFYDAYRFDGVFVSTNLSTTQKMLNLPSVLGRIFYLWDLEWIRIQQKEFRGLAQYYLNPRLKIVCRADDHAQAFYSAWGRRPDAIVENFNIEELLRVGHES